MFAYKRVICLLQAEEFFMNLKNIVFLTFVLLFFVSVGCKHGITSNSGLPPEAKNGLSLIGEWRSGCEERVKMVKKYYEYETSEYRKAYDLYIDAQIKCNTWIDTLIEDLQLGGKPSDRYNILLNEAKEKTENFDKYIKEVCASRVSRPRISVPINIEDIIKAIPDAVIKLWEIWRKVEKEKQKEIIELIREKKWRSFDDIK